MSGKHQIYKFRENASRIQIMRTLTNIVTSSLLSRLTSLEALYFNVPYYTKLLQIVGVFNNFLRLRRLTIHLRLSWGPIRRKKGNAPSQPLAYLKLPGDYIHGRPMEFIYHNITELLEEKTNR